MNNFVIRGYKSGDERHIISLFKEVFGKDMTIEQWKWKYYIPGCGKIYSKLAEDSEGNIVGHAGAIPLRGIFRGKPCQFFQIVDVMVHPKARGFFGKKNLFDMIIKNLFEDIGRQFPEVFCYGFPGYRPFILGKRIGVYDEIEKAFDYVKKPAYSLFNSYKIEDIGWNDISIDNLWTSISSLIGMSVVRDTIYIKWRYALNPYNNYKIYGAFCSGILKSWFVIKDNADEVFVVDYIFDNNSIMQAFKAFEKRLYKEKKKNFYIWLPKLFRNNFKNYQIKETPIIVANMIWKLPFKTDIVRDNLFYTMGDVDIF